MACLWHKRLRVERTAGGKTWRHNGEQKLGQTTCFSRDCVSVGYTYLSFPRVLGLKKLNACVWTLGSAPQQVDQACI